MKKMRNLFEEILFLGYDDDFEPPNGLPAMATAAPPGSWEKVSLLRERIERGEEMWHPNDEQIACTSEMSTLSGVMCREAGKRQAELNKKNRAEIYRRSGQIGIKAMKRELRKRKGA